MKSSVRVVGSIIIIFMILAVAEVLAYVATYFLARNNLFFTPLRITFSYEQYIQLIDPILGWHSRGYVDDNYYDASGSRRIPAFPNPSQNPACVSLYGDSFTEGVGVDHEHAWGNILSQLLNCRVANFGVAGYGTDQAYLRFLQNHQDQAKVVILGFLVENIQRNVNQLRNLISTVTACQMKPRFILDDRKQLTLVPIPPLSKKEFDELKQNPERVLHHEFFLPDGLSGRQKVGFPYSWGIIKILPLLYKTLVLDLGNYREFYQTDHPSQGVEVTAAIIEAFCRTARERSKQPVVLIIPTLAELLTYQRQQKWLYQPLIYLLARHRLEYIDAGPKFSQYLRGADPRTLYPSNLNYHLTEEGNRLLASIVYDFLTSRNLLPKLKKMEPTGKRTVPSLENSLSMTSKAR